MKTIIIYATKYGCSKSLAERMATLMGNSTLCDLKSGNPHLAEFDCVIIGGSLYAGMIRKEVKGYVNQYMNELKTKRIGLFLSGLDETNADTYFAKNFPKEILNIAHSKGFLGGIFDHNKAGWLDKFIFKTIKKTTESVSNLLEDNIISFVKDMKEVKNEKKN